MLELSATPSTSPIKYLEETNEVRESFRTNQQGSSENPIAKHITHQFPF